MEAERRRRRREEKRREEKRREEKRRGRDEARRSSNCGWLCTSLDVGVQYVAGYIGRSAVLGLLSIYIPTDSYSIHLRTSASPPLHDRQASLTSRGRGRHPGAASILPPKRPHSPTLSSGGRTPSRYVHTPRLPLVIGCWLMISRSFQASVLQRLRDDGQRPPFPPAETERRPEEQRHPRAEEQPSRDHETRTRRRAVAAERGGGDPRADPLR